MRNGDTIIIQGGRYAGQRGRVVEQSPTMGGGVVITVYLFDQCVTVRISLAEARG